MAGPQTPAGMEPCGNGPKLTQQDALEYIGSLVEGLHRIALQAELPFLAYLLSVVLEEANSRMSEQSANGRLNGVEHSLRVNRMTNPTLRTLTGMDPNPAPISKSALVLIDCQQTYRQGVMQLENVEAALKEADALLQRYRRAGRPVIHIMHDAGCGTPYDITAPIGQIAEVVAPIEGEPVIVKKLPSAFEQTNLDAELKKRGIERVVYVGFMTHICVNSTTRASFSRGYANTVVASATATRAIPNPATGSNMPAQQLQDASLSALGDMFAVVVPRADGIPD